MHSRSDTNRADYNQHTVGEPPTLMRKLWEAAVKGATLEELHAISVAHGARDPGPMTEHERHEYERLVEANRPKR